MREQLFLGRRMRPRRPHSDDNRRRFGRFRRGRLILDFGEGQANLAAAAQLDIALREQLRTVPCDDRALWAHVARETAGAFAAWSHSVEGATPGPLADTARILARCAQLRAHQVRPRPAGLPSARGGTTGGSPVDNVRPSAGSATAPAIGV